PERLGPESALPRGRITDSTGAWSPIEPPPGTTQVAAGDRGLLAVAALEDATPTLWWSPTGTTWSELAQAPDGTDRLDIVDGLVIAGGDPDLLAVLSPSTETWRQLPPSTSEPGVRRTVKAVTRHTDGSLWLVVEHSNRFDPQRYAPRGLDLEGRNIECITRTTPRLFELHTTPACSETPTAIAGVDDSRATDAWLTSNERTTTSIWAITSTGDTTERPLPAQLDGRRILRIEPQAPPLLAILAADGDWFTLRPTADGLQVEEVVEPIVTIGSYGQNQLGLGSAGARALTPHFRTDASEWAPLMVPAVVDAGPTAAVARTQPTQLGRTPISLNLDTGTLVVVPEAGIATIDDGPSSTQVRLQPNDQSGWNVILDDRTLASFSSQDWQEALDQAGYQSALGRLGFADQLIYTTRDGQTWLRSTANDIAGQPIHVHRASVSATAIVIEANDASLDPTALASPQRLWFRLNID
ncbi:MAG: hypothetical protein AAGA65_31580, partial [Actinomycetota bacterium]